MHLSEETKKNLNEWYIKKFGMTYNEFMLLDPDKQNELLKKAREEEPETSKTYGKVAHGQDLEFAYYPKGTRVITSDGIKIAGETIEEREQRMKKREEIYNEKGISKANDFMVNFIEKLKRGEFEKETCPQSGKCFNGTEEEVKEEVESFVNLLKDEFLMDIINEKVTLSELYEQSLKSYLITGKREKPDKLLAMLLLPKIDQFEPTMCSEGDYYAKYKDIIDNAIAKIEIDFDYNDDEYIKLFDEQGDWFNNLEEDKIWYLYSNGFVCLHGALMYNKNLTPEQIYEQNFHNSDYKESVRKQLHNKNESMMKSCTSNFMREMASEFSSFGGKIVIGNVFGNVSPDIEWIKWLNYVPEFEKERINYLENKKVYELSTKELKEIIRYRKNKEFAILFKIYGTNKISKEDSLRVFDFMDQESINELMVSKLTLEELKYAKEEIIKYINMPKEKLSQKVEEEQKEEVYNTLSMVDSYILHQISEIEYEMCLEELTRKIEEKTKENEIMMVRSRNYSSNSYLY